MNDERLIEEIYKNIIIETFNDYYEYNKEKSTLPVVLPPKNRVEVEYTFLTKNNNKYLVNFNIKENIYNSSHNSTLVIISFYMMSGKGDFYSSITNTGDSFKIISTVIKIIKEFLKFINLNKNDIIIFFAEEPSRQKLYDRIVRLLLPLISNTFAFYSEVESNDNSKYYKFVKKT